MEQAAIRPRLGSADAPGVGSQSRKRFAGALVPALVPFKPDYAPDDRKFVDFCRGLLTRGASALAVFGTTSEANSLSMAERQGLLEALVEGGVPAALLMPGTGMS